MVDLHADDLVRGLPWLKPVAACIGALLLVAGLSAWGGYVQGCRAGEDELQRTVAVAEQQKGRADAAEEREAQTKAQKALAQQVAEERGREVARLRAERDALPADPGPSALPADASLPVVAADLRSLGLAPGLLGGALPLGLSLGDGRTVAGWGREAQRVPVLRARLDATEALSAAQEGQILALQTQAQAGDAALADCDEGRLAERRRADAFEEALRRKPSERHWSLGGLVGVDFEGRRHLGAYGTWSWRAVQAHALYINRTAALGGGFRF
jgi:uncharacterized protein HemX